MVRLRSLEGSFTCGPRTGADAAGANIGDILTLGQESQDDCAGVCMVRKHRFHWEAVHQADSSKELETH